MTGTEREELTRLCRQAAGMVRGIRGSRWAGVPAAGPAPGRKDPTPPHREDVTSPAGEDLAALAREVGDCRKCPLHETRKSVVFGEGSATADLVFVGEGPGADEDRQGRPFVGKAGHLLDRMIAAMGLERNQVYIANVIKCRPPGNRNPDHQEIAACLPWLRRQLASLQPRVICTLGKFSSQSLLGTTETISRMRGRIHDFNGTPLIPTFHPAYLLRNPDDKGLAWEDIQKVMGLLGLPKAGENR